MEEEKIKKMYDQIHTPKNLKKETLEKMKEIENKKKFNYKYILSIAALFVIALTAGTLYYTNKKETTLPSDIAKLPEEKSIVFETESADLLHFKSVEEVKEYFKNNYSDNENYYTTEDVVYSTNMMKSAAKEETNAITDLAESDGANENKNYYQTNTQVENVDEADIVKTDGEYIYYVTNNSVYIVKADNLNLEAKINFLDNDEERYYPNEVFLKENKLIVIGNHVKYGNSDNIFRKRISNSFSSTKAYIYDISNKNEPKELRQVAIDGDYDTSRLVGNTLYLIGTKNVYYTKELNENDILPLYYDSALSNEYKTIDCTNIIYKEKADDSVYKTIGAVDINNNNEIVIESFLGYGDTVYCSENNLYLTVPIYEYGQERKDTNILNTTEIYKFSISGGGLEYKCKTTINGNVNNQFSLDEYNGNLRIATTVDIEEEPSKTTTDGEITTVEIGKRTTNNILYVLDENLNKISELTDFGITEKIYSVRFIKNIAYIVTFEQIDPLFVIDLSDPENPVMKGELEIPGYSSYLHPYDENHIIGIGYNVKDNGYGGVTNETVKISMFDVSDLENPKEIFVKTLGEGYSYTQVTYDHKLLMYDKERDLMGFPISMRNEKGKTEDGIVILKIDLEGNEFKIHSKYTIDNFSYYIRKVIYIEDTLYILGGTEILAFDINTLDNKGRLDLPYEENNIAVPYDLKVVEE